MNSIHELNWLVTTLNLVYKEVGIFFVFAFLLGQIMEEGLKWLDSGVRRAMYFKGELIKD